MDDLSALDWSSRPKTTGKAQPYKLPSPAFAALRPTPPTSGRSSPLPKSSSNAPSKSQTPANDSFSNLVSFSSAPTNKNLSLQEQQKRLLEEKAQQQAAKQKQLVSHYSGGDEQFWNSLGSDRSKAASSAPPSTVTGTQLLNHSGDPNRNGTRVKVVAPSKADDEEDILAAFKADAPVDSSSHFPKPFEHAFAPGDAGQYSLVFEDDDPFGLAQLPKKPSSKSPERTSQVEDEDVLGLLGKPVTEISQPQEITDPVPVSSKRKPISAQEQAIAELVEMGFHTVKAREALESTESGIDVQLAVGWLLNQAHSESRKSAHPRRGSNDGPRQKRDPRIDRTGGSRPVFRQSEETEPAQLSDRRSGPNRRQVSDPSSNDLDKDPAQMASEFGTAFLKTAGSLWKTSTKKVQQAVQDFNSDSDSSQPKWMREPVASRSGQTSDHNDGEKSRVKSRRRSSLNKKLESATDEAMMLESDRARLSPRKPLRRREPTLDSSADNSRDHCPAMPSRLRQESPAHSAFLQQQQLRLQQRSDHRAALNRQAIDDQASQAYVSSSRRRKPQTNHPVSASEPDLLENASQIERQSTARPATTYPAQRDRPSQSSTPVMNRPATLSRTIPQLPAISLKASHAQREAGNDHFKRGDYSAAHQSYTSSLKHLPASHPITIILYTNRALTALKIGEPKTAISDTDTAITIIGPNRGEGETVDLTNSEPPKPMRDYFGKALMRKAEALEQMERWKEAATAWKEAVEGGHGGATSIQGRSRCEKAAAPQQPKPAKPAPTKKSINLAQTRSANPTLKDASNRVQSAAAVNRLRAANAAAEKVDDEKFTLADVVDAKLTSWKGGKADNLRALLGSLDTVLWQEAGWRKIGMAELVLPAKVKVQYMKGIAKVHPDKVSLLRVALLPA
jgi:tetratricopeptide (TPR) repeat protein